MSTNIKKITLAVKVGDENKGIHEGEIEITKDMISFSHFVSGCKPNVIMEIAKAIQILEQK